MDNSTVHITDFIEYIRSHLQTPYSQALIYLLPNKTRSESLNMFSAIKYTSLNKQVPPERMYANTTHVLYISSPSYFPDKTHPKIPMNIKKGMIF